MNDTLDNIPSEEKDEGPDPDLIRSHTHNSVNFFLTEHPTNKTCLLVIILHNKKI